MAPGAMLGIQGPMEGGVNIHGESVSTRPVTVTAINYSDSHLDERTFTRPEDLRDLTLHPAVTWISVDGVSDTEIIQAIGDAVGIHPLTLEDIMNVHQRPKIENYEDCLYVVVQLFSPGGGDEFRREQVSLILGRDYVI